MIANSLIRTEVRDKVIDITFAFDEITVVGIYRTATPDIGWFSFLNPLKVKQ